MKKIKIKSQSRDYKIYIGFKNLDPLIKFLEENNFKKIMMIFDINTANFFGSKFFSLERKFDLHTCVIKSGEPSKSWETVNKIASNLLKKILIEKLFLLQLVEGLLGMFVALRLRFIKEELHICNTLPLFWHKLIHL